MLLPDLGIRLDGGKTYFPHVSKDPNTEKQKVAMLELSICACDRMMT